LDRRRTVAGGRAYGVDGVEPDAGPELPLEPDDGAVLGAGVELEDCVVDVGVELAAGGVVATGVDVESGSVDPGAVMTLPCPTFTFVELPLPELET
jgi:hypothetical protein